MQQKSRLARATTALLAMGVVLTSFAALAASEFQGAWKVKDSDGTPFTITLGAGGTAKADRPGKPMSGTWQEQGGAAVIHWNTGWTSKISKEGNQYKKSAWTKGQPMTSPPANSSEAEKAG